MIDRDIKTHESYEDYLKAIFLISQSNKGGWVSNSEISKFLDIQPSSVTNMLYKLRENDYVLWKPGSKIRLTKKGKSIAIKITQNFKCLEKFLTNVLNLRDNAIVHEFCCRVEHYITPQILEALKSLVFELKEF